MQTTLKGLNLWLVNSKLPQKCNLGPKGAEYVLRAFNCMLHSVLRFCSSILVNKSPHQKAGKPKNFGFLYLYKDFEDKQKSTV